MNSSLRLHALLRLVLIWLLFADVARINAQNDGNPWALLKPELAKLSHAAESKTRFTYFDLNHLQNFNEKGKEFVDTTRLFEVT